MARAVRNDKKEAILREAHCGIAGGHYAGDATTRKIWQSGLWWPTTLKDTIRYGKECDLYQQLGQPTEQARMPHHPVLPLEPFQKGDWISSDQLNHRRCGQVTDTLSSPPTIAQSGWKHKHYRTIPRHRQCSFYTNIYGVGTAVRSNS